ncbi:hypothetical protein [Williamsia serinedens]|uniref:hypothetical protein n=1 Tax=Williamsia serinedens TaxID=391736 RepID=UPI0031D2D752
MPSGEDTGFSFTVDKPKPATAQQIRYLNDLYIHRMCDVAPQAQVDQWKTFTTEQADEHIDRWKRSIPTGEDYPGPERGEWAYNRLSTIGQDFADNKFLPLDVSA